MDKKLINYNTYQMTKLQIIKEALIGILLVFLLGLVFYGSVYISLVLSLLGLLYLPYKKKKYIEIRKKKLKLQFKEGLYGLSSSISAGKSIEKAFEEVLIDLRILYKNEDAYIVSEFEYIVNKIKVNETLEDTLLDFSIRAGDEDISNFVQVFIAAKRTGGNIVDIMSYTINVLNEKIEILNNIEVLVTQKKYEQKILALILPLIITYLYCFSDGFLDAMYETIQGRVGMSIALALYIISFLWGKEIVDIKV